MPASHSWRALVLFTAVLALLASGCSSSSSNTGDGSEPSGRREVPTAVSGANVLEPITEALKAHDRAAFLKLGAGEARTRMATWWDNLDAIGFDTGAVSMPSGPDQSMPLDREGRGTARLRIGVHSPLDPVHRKDGAHDRDRSYLPSTTYDLGVTVSDPSEQATITSWKPHDVVAPWDGPKLYVRKAENVVLAGPQTDKGRIDGSIEDAQAAARWTLDFFDKRLDSLVLQRGFVTFTASDRTVFDTWFTKPEDLQGWVADKTGLASPMAGYAGIDPEFQPLPVGGARVTVPGDQMGEDLRATLVHEFTHVLFAPWALWFNDDGTTMPAWVAEGTARLVESTYRVHDPQWQYTTAPIKAKIQQCVRDGYFHDRGPTDDEIYRGTPDEGACAYDIAAGLLGSLGRSSDTSIWYSIRLAYGSNTEPWRYVIRSNAGGSISYFPPEEMARKAVADFHTFYGV